MTKYMCVSFPAFNLCESDRTNLNPVAVHAAVTWIWSILPTLSV